LRPIKRHDPNVGGRLRPIKRHDPNVGGRLRPIKHLDQNSQAGSIADFKIIKNPISIKPTQF